MGDQGARRSFSWPSIWKAKLEETTLVEKGVSLLMKNLGPIAQIHAHQEKRFLMGYFDTAPGQ